MADYNDLNVDQIKIKRFKNALIESEGNISEAADMLNITRDTAYRWMKKNKSIKRLVKELRRSKRDPIDDEYDD